MALEFAPIPIAEYLHQGGRGVLVDLVRRRWAHIYSPEARSPAAMVDMLATIPDCWVGLVDHDVRAVVWFSHDGHELFPNLHILLLQGLFRDAWERLMELTFRDRQFWGFYVCGYDRQVIRRWLQQLPYGTLHRLPRARIDPRNLQITGWWEFVCHRDDYTAWANTCEVATRNRNP